MTVSILMLIIFNGICGTATGVVSYLTARLRSGQKATVPCSLYSTWMLYVLRIYMMNDVCHSTHHTGLQLEQRVH